MNVTITQMQLQISALSKPIFIKLINSDKNLKPQKNTFTRSSNRWYRLIVYWVLSSLQAENDYFDQRLVCTAPKCWSKYTTCHCTSLVILRLSAMVKWIRLLELNPLFLLPDTFTQNAKYFVQGEIFAPLRSRIIFG